MVAKEVAGCLKDPEAKGRRAAAQTLAALGPAVASQAPRAVARLARLLDDSDALCAAEAARALGALGTPEALAAAAEHHLGCETLAVAGPRALAYAPRLRELVLEGPSHVRASAVQALGPGGTARTGPRQGALGSPAAARSSAPSWLRRVRRRCARPRCWRWGTWPPAAGRRWCAPPWPWRWMIRSPLSETRPPWRRGRTPTTGWTKLE